MEKKTTDQTDINLLRPINIISVFSKLIEKALTTQLIRYMTENNLVSQSLQGGIKGRSSTLTVLSIHENLVNLKSNKKHKCIGHIRPIGRLRHD